MDPCSSIRVVQGSTVLRVIPRGQREDVEQRREVEGVTGGHVISKYDFLQKLHPALLKFTTRAQVFPTPLLPPVQPSLCCVLAPPVSLDERKMSVDTQTHGRVKRSELKGQPGSGECCLMGVLLDVDSWIISAFVPCISSWYEFPDCLL